MDLPSSEYLNGSSVFYPKVNYIEDLVLHRKPSPIEKVPQSLFLNEDPFR